MSLRLTKMVAVIIVFTLTLAILGTPSQAQPSTNDSVEQKALKDTRTFELKPQDDSDYVLDEVKYTKLEGATDREDGAFIEAKGAKKAGTSPVAYDIIVDPKTKTYQAEKLERSELRAVISNQQQFAEPRLDKSSTSSSARSSRRNYWAATVSIVTRDPAWIRVVQSNHRLGWSSGSRVLFNYRQKWVYAGCPNRAGTCWRNSFSRFRGSPQYIDGGRTLASRYEASFYNYNFGDPRYATIAKHDSSIYARNSSSFRYYWRWYARGEAYDLLWSRVVIN